MSELGYSRYGASGYDFGAGVTTILALDHPESVIGIHLTTLESDLAPVVDDTETVRCRAFVSCGEPGLGYDGAGLQRRSSPPSRRLSAMDSTTPRQGSRHTWVRVALVEPTLRRPDDFLCATLTLYWITQSITSSMPRLLGHRWHPVDPTYVSNAHGVCVFAHQTVPRANCRARI